MYTSQPTKVKDKSFHSGISLTNYSDEESPLIVQAHKTHLINKNMLDIFKYDQIPSVQRESSSCSIFWGGLLLFGFFMLTIYTIYEFLTNNPPSLNIFETNLPDSNNYTLPQIAISFVSDSDIDTPDIYDTSIFNVQMHQVFDGLDLKSTFIEIPMQRCTKHQVKWIKEIKRNLLLCPSGLPNLQGLLDISPHFEYGRVIISLCDTLNSSKCETNQTRIGQVLAGGRMYLYIEQPDQVKLKNFEQSKSVRFQTYEIFLQQGQYTRNEIILKSTQYIIYPDYVTQLFKEQTNILTTNGNFNSFVSNVTAVGSKRIFAVWFRMDSQIQNIEAVYLTSIDKLATLGALWGIFYALFFYVSYKCKKWSDSNQSINHSNETMSICEENPEFVKQQKFNDSLQAQVKTLTEINQTHEADKKTLEDKMILIELRLSIMEKLLINDKQKID